ncbi:hypothetical protein GCK72_017177 [Caenorhabditis remanei]|uniref:BPTI/Kunitz inhibitor domain-containing protein n=1 Tax=Caenorhabditis remanei TaxID=31234 RepID=A0A6A5G708_CAERE|nr:hypothetical protein GCK72_017177 [Caenorhabditis remanei]KAF1750626.1 hypothetical protein GCK72_017177 [Caenorhabditis remanei]
MKTILFLFVLEVYWTFALRRARNSLYGPCALNNDGEKCDKNGYFEIVQCNLESCYCVTPHTASIAQGTRTNSSKTVPNCGTCITYLQKLFANGNPPKNSFVPECDVDKGDFEPVQCDSAKNQCYCVSTNTGKEIFGSRKPLSNTTEMECSIGIDTSNKTSINHTPPYPNPWCTTNRDAGHTCSQNKTSIRYWFDPEAFHCFRFEYKGCGGNRNNYKTSGECLKDCVAANYSSCAMQSEPARRENGELYKCSESYGCPQGYSCYMGVLFGMCCDDKITNRYHAALEPKCQNNMDGKREYSGPLIGKSCSDNFCPSNFTCESNELFAHCCPK